MRNDSSPALAAKHWVLNVLAVTNKLNSLYNSKRILFETISNRNIRITRLGSVVIDA
uniref:Uncharacterized protein MANES_11G081600 n=1 Tax=Rhizophora mucronata TaxID=61149 RepID=A0A2P2QJ44_RHIMU